MTRVWLRGLPAGLRLPGQEAQTATAKPKPAKRQKYGNKKVTNHHGTFDSVREWERFQVLMLKQRGGLITNLRRQVRFELVHGVKLAGEKRARPAIRYFADFVYVEHGQEIIEDAKGRQTPDYRLKKHLMKALLGLDIVEV